MMRDIGGFGLLRGAGSSAIVGVYVVGLSSSFCLV
jgi:hypothetical protein